MSLAHEISPGLVLAFLGAGLAVGGIAPTARSTVPIGLIALMPIGFGVMIVASIAIARQSAEPTAATDVSLIRRALLGIAATMGLAGAASSWLALAEYRDPAIQVAGVAGGVLCMVCATAMFGWYRGIGTALR